MTLQERISALLGYPIALGDVVVMTCESTGDDHLGEEHTLPAGAVAIVSKFDEFPTPQNLGITLSIPVDPASDFDDENSVGIIAVFDEGDTENRFAFRLATAKERARLNPSWLSDFQAS
jgi:hypothetical protein